MTKCEFMEKMNDFITANANCVDDNKNIKRVESMEQMSLPGDI